MRRLIISLGFAISALTLCGNTAAEEELEDVIYKTDGSVLRGELIEQDFAAGKYKIRLMGGSVFSVQQNEISKITKEPFIIPIPQKALKKETPAVNVQVTQTGISNQQNDNQTQFETASAAHYPQVAIADSNQPAYPPHVVSFGYTTRNFNTTTEYEYYNYDSNYNYGYYESYTEEVDYDFDGFGLAYQANLTNHFSAYIEYSRTKLDKIRIKVDDIEDDIDPQVNWTIKTLQALAILTTNNGRGWQFYLGGGLFDETHKLESWPEENMNGQVFMLGSTYAWEKLQAQLRIFVYESDDFEDFNSSGVNLHLGMHL